MSSLRVRLPAPIENLPTELLCLICECIQADRIDIWIRGTGEFQKVNIPENDVPNWTVILSDSAQNEMLSALASTARACKKFNDAGEHSLNNVLRNSVVCMYLRRIVDSEKTQETADGYDYYHKVNGRQFDHFQLDTFDNFEIVIPCCFEPNRDPMSMRMTRTKWHNYPMKVLTVRFSRSWTNSKSLTGTWSCSSRQWETIFQPKGLGHELIPLAYAMDITTRCIVKPALRVLNDLQLHAALEGPLQKELAALAFEVGICQLEERVMSPSRELFYVPTPLK